MRVVLVVGIQRGRTSASTRTARALLVNVMRRRYLAAIMKIIIVVTRQDHSNLVPSLCRRWERRMGMVFRLGSPAGSRPSNGHQVIFRGWSHGVIGGAGGVKNI